MYERWGHLVKRAELDVIEFDCHTKQEMAVIGRCNPFYVMSYLKSGEALLRMKGREYKIPSGSIIVVPPGVVHDHIKTSKEDAVFLWWHFNFTVAGSIDILKLIRLPVITIMNDIELFESYFSQYMDAIGKSESLPSLIYKNAKGLEILSCMFENIMASTVNDMELHTDISDVFLDILDDISNSTKANISLGAIAEKYHMNPTYISNRFKDHFGISPIFLHREMLLQRAKEFLSYSSLSISEISDKLGFNDIASFTRFFSEKQSISPSKYRDMKN